MKIHLTLTWLCMALWLPLAAHAERTHLSAIETVDINASPEVVWQEIRDFNGMANWHPAIVASRVVAGKNNVTGAARELKIKDGPLVYDELVSIDDAQRSYIYRLVDSPLPLTDYLSIITVKQRGEGSEVIWATTFRRKNVFDTAPEEENDQAAIQLLSGVYRGGLDNLKVMLEQ